MLDPGAVNSVITAVIAVVSTLGALGGYEWRRSRNGSRPASYEDVRRIGNSLEQHIQWSTEETGNIHSRVTDLALAMARHEGISEGRRQADQATDR